MFLCFVASLNPVNLPRFFFDCKEDKDKPGRVLWAFLGLRCLMRSLFARCDFVVLGLEMPARCWVFAAVTLSSFELEMPARCWVFTAVTLSSLPARCRTFERCFLSFSPGFPSRPFSELLLILGYPLQTFELLMLLELFLRVFLRAIL